MTGGEIGVIIAQSAAAAGTLTLAIAAFKQIRQTKTIQANQTTEARLGKIADWATDILTASNKSETSPAPNRFQFEFEHHWQDAFRAWELSAYSNVLRQLEMVGARGAYMTKLAESVNDADLKSKVEEAIVRVFSLCDQIRDRIRKEEHPPIGDDSWQPVSTAARRVIERVSELMRATS